MHLGMNFSFILLNIQSTPFPIWRKAEFCLLSTVSGKDFTSSPEIPNGYKGTQIISSLFSFNILGFIFSNSLYANTTHACLVLYFPGWNLLSYMLCQVVWSKVQRQPCRKLATMSHEWRPWRGREDETQHTVEGEALWTVGLPAPQCGSEINIFHLKLIPNFQPSKCEQNKMLALRQ